MSNCENCTGGCGGCANELTLTAGELTMLETLAQIPFLPIARKTDDVTPFYLEDDAFSTEEYSIILQLLEKKGLVTLDFDQPLKNYTGCADFPIHGSMALTARGQGVLDLLEKQGVQS